MENGAIKFWEVKCSPFWSRDYDDARIQALEFFKLIKGKSKRKIHIRSIFFENRKVFFDHFWDHLFQKPIAQRKARLRLLPCSIELIQNSRFDPISKVNPNNDTEIVHRFYGNSKDQVFAVQVKEMANSLQFMSVFPTKKPR